MSGALDLADRFLGIKTLLSIPDTCSRLSSSTACASTREIESVTRHLLRLEIVVSPVPLSVHPPRLSAEHTEIFHSCAQNHAIERALPSVDRRICDGKTRATWEGNGERLHASRLHAAIWSGHQSQSGRPSNGLCGSVVRTC